MQIPLSVIIEMMPVEEFQEIKEEAKRLTAFDNSENWLEIICREWYRAEQEMPLGWFKYWED